MAVSERFKKPASTPSTQSQVQKNAALTKTLPQPIASVQQHCQLRLAEMLNECLASSDIHFITLAKNSKLSVDQDGYFYAMRELYSQKKILAEMFSLGINRCFVAIVDAEVASTLTSNFKDIPYDQLALVTDAEIEMLATKEMMINRALARYQIPVDELAARFSVAAGKPIDIAMLPIGPTRLCELFVGICKTLALSTHATEVLFKIFERTVLQTLGKLYNDMNAHLDALGVRPASTEKKSVVAQSSAKQLPTRQPTESPRAEIKSLENRIQENARSEKKAPAAAIPDKSISNTKKLEPRKPEASVPEIKKPETKKLEAKNPEPKKSEAKKPEAKRPETKKPEPKKADKNSAVINNSAASQRAEPEKLTAAAQPTPLLKMAEPSVSAKPKVIQSREQIVERALAVLGEQQGLGAQVTPLLAQLHKLLANIAQNDDSFFNSRHHGARRLLNSLSASAFELGKSGSADVSADPLFAKMKTVVDQLPSAGLDDSKAMIRLADELEQFREQEKQRLKQHHQRLLTAEKGKQQTDIIQRQVRLAIAEITQDLDLHSSVQRVIDQAWFRVMYVSALRYGIDSKPWDEVSHTLTDLVIATQPYFNQAERDHGLASLSALKQRVRAGLESILFDAAATQDIVDLVDKTIRALTQDASKKSTAQIVPIPTALDQTSTHLPETVFIEQAKSLSEDVWVDLTLADGQDIRCRLAAIMGDHDLYVFMARDGKVVAEKTLAEVAQGLAQKSLVLHNNHKLFDLALAQVVEGIKKR
jgi:Protein of unknown function (DUF1631)